MTTPRQDAGDSLVEILLAVAIVGIAFASILAGLGTAVTVSGVNREQADDTSYVRSIAERVEKADFVACADVAHYEAALTDLPVPNGATRALQVRYWTGSAFHTACPAGTSLHEVTVTTTPGDERATSHRPLTVLKRKP